MDSIVPNQEYLLQGSVMDSAVEVLLHRLRGLCDNVDSGPETFHDHEMCFSIRVSSLTPVQPVLLRVRRAVDYPEMPWQLRYIGQPEMLHNKPTDPVETISQSYLVELSVLAPCGQDAIAEDMRSFSEQLRPLVQLEKVDFNRLHHLT
uniref:Mediator of RNA polymerase II transcription subunit 18 n=2 Tax=Timema TaxID=61471 RepID=A0A7R9E5T8_9NEOP|nr:unnamed protein product [Timema douglasi]CAD7428010.1 unnamed protein product [Timema monikensis]